MTTTDTTMPAPSWLNLDAVCPPELRVEIENLVPEARALAEQVNLFCARVLELRFRVEDAEEDSGISQVDDIGETINTFTGWHCIEDSLSIIEGSASAAGGANVSGTGYADACASFGVAPLAFFTRSARRAAEVTAGAPGGTTT